MFTRRLSWLPTLLLCLLFVSPALSGHSPSTTPYDPFHAIAVLAPKPPEEPVCCLKPLTPLEPVDDDLFLSFEDWKLKRFSESGHAPKNNNASPNPGAEGPAEAVAIHSTNTTADTFSSSSAAAAAAVDDAIDAAHGPELVDVALTAAQGAAEGTTSMPPPPPPPPPASPHFRVPLTDRFNYASVDCSARVHTAQPAAAAKSAANILSSQRDRYMLSPCGATPRFVVVELCEDVRIDTVQLANFEFFSGVFREFTVSVAKTYVAADAEGWTVVGTYVGKNVRGVQSFHPPTSIRDFYRYIRIDFHSHYSNEYYCPISLLRVYGLTHLEQWKWDTWEEESRARQDQNAQIAPTVLVDVLSEPEHHAPETPGQEQGDVSTPLEKLSLVTPSGESNPDIQDQDTVSSHPLEGEEGHFRHSTVIAQQEPSTSPQAPSTGTSSSNTTPSSSVPPQPSVSVQTTNDSTQKPHLSPSNDSINSTTASSSVFISSRSANVSGPIGSTSRSSSQSTVTTISAPVIQASASPHPQVNIPLPLSPSNVHTGESIYRTIMNRLSALEANTTLYARYVEEQTSAMREMLRRLSEDVGRLEGIGRAQAQMYARSVSDFEKHRKEMEIEQRTLISQVNYLAEEIVLEKRLGIAQLCLLLAVLVFLSVTRGSPGEFHIPRSNSSGVDNMRNWGRRSLRLSGDWFPSRLRSASSGPPSASQGSHTPTPSISIPRALPRQALPSTAPATSLPSPSKTPGPGPRTSRLTSKAAATTTMTTPTFRQKRQPLYLVTPVHHNHHRVPRSRSSHAVARTRVGGRAASPTPMALPIQRSNSHGAPFVGPVPRSARRWARSSHVHEVRRARHQHHRLDTSVVGVDEDVFGAATPGRSLGLSESRSAPPMGSFGIVGGGADGRGGSGGTAAGRMSRLALMRREQEQGDGGGGLGPADTWVDTDTDTVADDDGDGASPWGVFDLDVF